MQIPQNTHPASSRWPLCVIYSTNSLTASTGFHSAITGIFEWIYIYLISIFALRFARSFEFNFLLKKTHWNLGFMGFSWLPEVKILTTENNFWLPVLRLTTPNNFIASVRIETGFYHNICNHNIICTTRGLELYKIDPSTWIGNDSYFNSYA